jgi:hypothetical protein
MDAQESAHYLMVISNIWARGVVLDEAIDSLMRTFLGEMLALINILCMNA